MSTTNGAGPGTPKATRAATPKSAPDAATQAAPEPAPGTRAAPAAPAAQIAPATQAPPATQAAQWFPPEWPERIRALANGELEPPVARRAATVLLLRDAAAGPVVYMLRRRASMAFAGGAYAYPGGSVDARDEERDTGWAGPSRAQWAVRLGTDETTAQAIVCAAVRETFEEAGVLLAGPDAETVVADTTGDDWEADRAALVARELSFADFLARRSLVLRSDLLGGWARWITPEFEPRRYDTWFFAAALPEGQRTRNASTEADRTVWIRPQEAAAGYDQGELLMMPPTISTLRQLVPYATAADALAASAGRDLTPVLARATLRDGEIELSWPGHEEFTRHFASAGPATPGASTASVVSGTYPAPETSAAPTIAATPVADGACLAPAATSVQPAPPAQSAPAPSHPAATDGASA
ncbi:8-oxo-dGTP pyrophosphatase MutT (NUDIX family) [Streptomyces zagrosensis]|uniref:8-oxo-dGTP pyrophosphatase MutT (NUDIX family) n=1 Tax=Streptomyces zagrosensis TaxID=1042984 RepID=A0A7W9QFU3_9ACTN|nr:8-oxo-dGTP pyrophosphatase MutT (NUDIX family) [Streptomyces zagrosensis]